MVTVKIGKEFSSLEYKMVVIAHLISADGKLDSLSLNRLEKLECAQVGYDN